MAVSFDLVGTLVRARRPAERFGVPITVLVHVGDDARSDGGATTAGARAILLDDVPLPNIPAAIGDR